MYIQGFTTCIDARGKGMEYKARPVSSLETAPSSDNLPTRLLVLSFWQTLYRTLLNLTRPSGLTAIEGFWYLHYRGKAHLITDHERVIAWVFQSPARKLETSKGKSKSKSKRGKRNESDKANPFHPRK
ncbi:fdbc9cf3-e065-4bb4-a7e3-bf64af65d1b9 [Sclerotinia trifoliorum]|uniref:Fdbc9cf3-e065-4bb4-a7e3-bf64af65d1b9 n=1 Tax=Sclerotinia trifoliorum TaxID=28548 RepID=A0A8H2VTK1_9HELO|nr:fdbc9cf3-e065-4bb4-a7e3-bf64af65d1b9 [Sclerotinia trifoliorum]